MTKASYGVGDQVFLVNGPVRTGRAEGEFTIVACLPDVNGMAQYRVRSDSETFERRIVDTDIDADRSQSPGAATRSTAATGPKGSWFDAGSIKVGKQSS